MLGDRTAVSLAGFVLSDLADVLVRDRYKVYRSARVGTLTYQLCCAHLLHDLKDTAQTYPAATWPAQITAALTGLIRAPLAARDAGQGAIPAAVAGPPNGTRAPPGWPLCPAGSATTPAGPAASSWDRRGPRADKRPRNAPGDSRLPLVLRTCGNTRRPTVCGPEGNICGNSP
jgi:Transposase IS66 family